MEQHRYILEPYKTLANRYTCPCCGKRRTFTRYVDTETGEHINNRVGRCNRTNNCGYHKKPREYFRENFVQDIRSMKIARRCLVKSNTAPKLVSTIPAVKFRDSLKEYDSNRFVSYLTSLFGKEVTEQLIGRYYIGTSKHWQGATVFYQIDQKGKIRAGKIMLYDPQTGKRVKERYSHLTWVHTVLKMEGYNLKQCFFGEHLLKAEPEKQVAIVESEKTAVIASVFMPQFVWLAAGGKEGLNAEKCQALKGRKVSLFPDLGAFTLWNNKAKELSYITAFQVSDLLERKATEAERDEGLDIADYLIKSAPAQQETYRSS